MRVDLVDGDTWVGLYFDERLVQEDHSIDAWQVIKLLAHADRKIKIGEYWFACNDWLDTKGSFPDDLKDVVVSSNAKSKTIREIWEHE